MQFKKVEHSMTFNNFKIPLFTWDQKLQLLFNPESRVHQVGHSRGEECMCRTDVI